MMNIVKPVISIATNFGVSQVITNIIKVTTPDNLSKARKIATIIGGVAVSMVITGVITEQVEEQIDGVAAFFRKDSNEEVEIINESE